MAEAETITVLEEAQPKRKKPRRPSAMCKMDGCPEWAWAQGYCDNHYQKLKRDGIIAAKRIMNDPLKRFHTKYKTNEVTGCWDWIAFVHPKGYGAFHVTINKKLVYRRAHRFAFEALVGPIPDGLQVLHRCDNRRCVNPEHLFVGDDFDNMRDCVQKGHHAGHRGTNGYKLSAKMAMNIRIRYARSEGSMLDISRIYGVEEETIRGILKGHSHLG